MYCAQSEVYHLGGGTLNTENPFKTYLNFRNNLLLLQKNLPFWRALFIITARYVLDLLAIFRFLSEGKRKDAWAVSKAHQNFARNMFKTGHRDIDPTHNLRGMYRGCLVWDFFIKKKHTFTELDKGKFYK